MELWVRSQDRKLLEKAVMIKTGIVGETPVIVVNNDYVYGEYKTKERALEVLDEIQGKITVRKENEYGVEYIMINDVAPIIYEMPKE